MQIKTRKEELKKEHDKLYNDYVRRVTPTHNCWLNMVKAFISGGIICMIGQGFYDLYTRLGSAKEIVSGYTTLTLILISVLLTCLNLVNPITKFAGAGYLVPITGFANSVASCALEFKSEGKSLVSAVRYLPLQVRLFSMVLLQAGFLDFYTGL